MIYFVIVATKAECLKQRILTLILPVLSEVEGGGEEVITSKKFPLPWGRGLALPMGIGIHRGKGEGEMF